MKCIRGEFLDGSAGEGCQVDFPHPFTGGANFDEPLCQRMFDVDILASIGGDEKQILQVGSVQKKRDQIQCGHVEPLQVVEEKHERMVRLGEDANEASNDELEASLCVLRGASGTGG